MSGNENGVMDIAPGSEVRLRTADRGWKWACSCCPVEQQFQVTEVIEQSVQYVCTLSIVDALELNDNYTILWMAEVDGGEFLHYGETVDGEIVLFSDDNITTVIGS